MRSKGEGNDECVKCRICQNLPGTAGRCLMLSKCQKLSRNAR